MNLRPLRLGYVPLMDASPMIAAHELGFAAEEGLALDLVPLQSWAQSRDYLGAGAVDAAHMLLAMPIVQRLGLGPMLPDFDVLMILSQGGQAVAVSTALAQTMRDAGHGFDFADPRTAGAALHTASKGQLRVAVPFHASTHSELVWHWLGAVGFDPAMVSVRTVPPPMMAQALATGEVDAFCVGEPWASVAVDAGVGVMLLPGRAIWAGAPDKGLVMTRAVAAASPDTTAQLMRAVWRAGKWLDQPGNRSTMAEILSRPHYLNLPSEVTERALLGRFLISAAGEVRLSPHFVGFHDGVANFPWKSVAALFADRIARQHGLDPEAAMLAAMDCFRTDLFRLHLRPAGVDLPGASAKVEGAISHPTAVASEKGSLILRPDAFFDGRLFDPPLQNR
jgi:two-component system, oxyanion-binding sensor